MGISHDVMGWALIILAAVNAARAPRKLATARRSGARSSAILAGVWSELCFTLIFLAEGVLFLRNAHPAWSFWILVALGTSGLMAQAVPGIVSRRKAGAPWWRFGVRVIPPPSAAGFTGLSEDSHLNASPADTLEPRSAIVLDASTLDLIEKITNARFSTVRLSRGYDEEDVDIFLDKLTAALSEGGQLNQAELLNARFTTTRLRPGYVMQDVDSLVHEIARAAPF